VTEHVPAAAGKLLPRFAAVEFPPLIDGEPDPAWSFGIYAQYVVLHFFRELLEQRRVVWDNEDIEGVHRIRVAARRCRTALQTFSTLWDAAEVQRFQQYLARFADAFGAARDLDVMLIYLREQLAVADGERQAAYRWLLERNAEKRAAEQPRLEQALQRFEDDGVPAALTAFFSRLPVDIWALGVHRG